MAYRGQQVLVVAFLILLVHLSLVPPFGAAAALSFQYDFSIPGVLSGANLLYRNDSFQDGDKVSLTKMTNVSAGRVASLQPLRLWDSRSGSVASFSTSFSFAIIGNHNSTRGDGMAFFVGQFPPIAPADSFAGFLGLYNNPAHSGSPPVVAVEFDTFWNEELDPPDISGDHVGIDVNSIHSTAYTTDLPNLGLSGRMSANITYDAGSKKMAVSLQLEDGSNHHVETLVDLVAAGLQQYAAVGFSAATGAFWESHQILSWSFNSTDLTADVPLTDPPCKTKSLLRICIIVQTALSAGLAAALLCIYARIWIKRPRRLGISLPVAREFSYNTLSAATNNFSKEQLGAGSFGEVYRGDLPGQLAVAVKKLTVQSAQTRRDYVTEVTILGQLYHPNLVKLVGWCDGGGERLLLVYELMANRSVDRYLHGPERLLTWPERYKMVLGVGHAIEYLHGFPNPILHRDIKPSNVMLDGDFEAKLGDFGLVRQVSKEGYLRGTDMRGSNDYIDPVCKSDYDATTASDMYSFGVLLLEVATGKNPTTMHIEEKREGALIEAVRDSYNKGTVVQMADSRLSLTSDDEKRQVERVLVVGLLCVQQRREDRPEIRKAVNMLLDLSCPVPQIRS